MNVAFAATALLKWHLFLYRLDVKQISNRKRSLIVPQRAPLANGGH
jgi:hypothetical protein